MRVGFLVKMRLRRFWALFWLVVVGTCLWHVCLVVSMLTPTCQKHVPTPVHCALAAEDVFVGEPGGGGEGDSEGEPVADEFAQQQACDGYSDCAQQQTQGAAAQAHAIAAEAHGAGDGTVGAVPQHVGEAKGCEAAVAIGRDTEGKVDGGA